MSRNVDLGTFVKRAFAGISKAFESAKVVVSRGERREKELGRVGPKTADPQGDRDPFFFGTLLTRNRYFWEV